jgi:hypothetical protein
VAANQFTQAQEEPDEKALALKWQALEKRTGETLTREEVLAVWSMQERAQAIYHAKELIALLYYRRNYTPDMAKRNVS